MKDSTNSNINDMTASVIETDINKEVDNILNAESIDIDSVLEEINEKYGIHTKELDIDKLLSSEDIKESMSEDNILSLILNSLEAKELIKAIKDKANPPILDKETDLAKDQRLATLTKAFIDLAELYMDKANAYEGDDSKQTKIQYYTEATKLLNYALSTNQAITSRAFLSGVLGIEQIHNEIESKLEQIYIKVIALVGENINQAGIASAIEHAKNDKKFLKDLREHTRSKVAEIDDIDNDAARSTATNRLFTHITDQMKSYLAEIYHQSEETLGKAPCEYAIFGLGSMALGQMTPYSDLEFAILTANGDEQSKEYFRDLTCIVHLRIINLGETVINKKDIDDALIYHLINRGVNFDLGGKTPIAVRNKPELIATVDEMASYLKNINNNKNWIDTSNILEATVFVGGKKGFYDQFEKGVNEFLFHTKNADGIFHCEDRALKKLREGIKENKIGNLEEFRPKLIGPHVSGKLFDAKQEIYRLPDRLMSSLTLLYKINPLGVWQDVELLKSNGIISEQAEENLNNAISFATLLRLKAYLYYNRQREDLHIDYGQSKDENLFYIAKDNEKLFKFYYTIIPLYNKLTTLSDSLDNKLILLQGNNLFEESDVIRGYIYYRIMDYNNAKIYLEKVNNEGESVNIEIKDHLGSFTEIVHVEIKHLLSLVYYELSDFAQALQTSADALQILKTTNHDDYPQVAISLSIIASIYSARSEYEKAIICYVESLKIYKANQVNDCSKVSQCIRNIAAIYYQQGKYEESLKIYKSALSIIKETSYYYEYPQIPVILNNIAAICSAQGKNKAALTYYHKSVLLAETIYGHYHPDIAVSLNNIAVIYRTQGEYEKALISYQESLCIIETTCGRNRPDFAACLNNIAVVYGALDKYEEALAHYQKALRITETIYNCNHPASAISLNNIAEIYYKQGKYEEAIIKFQESLKITKTIHGDNHPAFAISLGNIAKIYQTLGKYEEALTMHQQALQIFESTYGYRNSDVATCINNIALVYYKQGKYEDAIMKFQESLDILETTYGHIHPAIAVRINNIAAIYYQLEQYEDALKKHQEALQIREIIYGANHAEVAISLNNIATIYRVQYKYEEALAHYQKALQIFENVYGPKNPEVAKVLNNIAVVYGALGKYEEALAHYQKALQIFESIYGPKNPEVITISNNIVTIYNSINLLKVAIHSENAAEIYRAQGKHEEALDHYQKALHIFEDIYGYNHMCVVISLHNIAVVYGAQGKLEEALKKLHEAFKIREKINSNESPDVVILNEKIFKLKNNYFKITIEASNSALTCCSEMEIQKKISLNHNLGCYYHALAELNSQSGKKELYNDNIKSAIESFEQAIELSVDNISTGLSTEYANFLIQSNRGEESIIHLKQAIVSTVDNSGLSYGQMEKVTLDESLQNEIDFWSEITIKNPVVFAYYLLIKAQSQLSDVDQTNELVEQFKGYIEDNTDPLAYSLFGYSCKVLGKFEEAALAFEQAASLYQATEVRPEYDLALENQAICFSLISSSTTTMSNENNVIQDEVEKNTEIRHMKPIYNNPILNDLNIQQIMQTAYQYGKTALVDRIINLGQNPETYKSLVESIKLSGIEATISKEILHNSFDSSINIESNTSPVSTNSINNKFIDQAEFLLNNDFTASDFTSTAKPNTKTNQGNTFNLQTLTISSFAVKEMIESAAMLKYFTYEVLGVQYIIPKKLQEIELPEFTKQNYFWVAMHYAAGAIGAFTLPTSDITLITKIATPIASASVYRAKLAIYDTLTQQKQIAMQSGEDKPIDNPSEFLEKCGLDIAAYSALSLISSGTNKVMIGMPLSIAAYDILISATLGGIQCYSAYQKTENVLPKTALENILPSIADATILYTTTKNMHFDFSNVFTSMIGIKQGLAVVSAVAATDKMIKLLLSVSKENLNNLEEEYTRKILSTVDKIFIGILGEESAYFNEANG